MPRLALAVGVAIIATACGYSQPPSASSTTAPPSSTTTTSLPATSTTTTTEPGFSATLDIAIGTDGKPGEYTATLACSAENVATGYLDGEAETACAFLESSEEARTRLIEGPPEGQVCTEIYGGSEVATITGSINGEPVSTTVDRANGCGIADWDLLRPILVEPYDMLRYSCSAAGMEQRASDPQGDLPAKVAELRDQLIALASECDIDGLGTLALENGTETSFGGSGDPAVQWREEEAHGYSPLRAMVTVLTFAPGVQTIEGVTYYEWPGVFALGEWSQATDAQRQELADVFGQDALDDWDAFGGYAGYRVGITEDGRWAFYVAGD